MDLKTAVAMLAQAREVTSEKADAVTDARAALERTPEWQALQAATQAFTQADVLTKGIRGMVDTLAVAAYQASGDKVPAPGVHIRVSNVYEHDIMAEREWCLANMPMCLVPNPQLTPSIRALCITHQATSLLTVDTKILVAACKDLENPPFTRHDDPHVAIDTDLSEYLAEMSREQFEALTRPDPQPAAVAVQE